MRNRNALRSSLLAALFVAPALPLLAAEDPALKVKLQEPEPPTKNRFGVSYRAGYNITARFKNASRGGVGSAGPATGGAVDRNYDDGYNRVDKNGNNDNLTWNWAYKNDNQVPPGNGLRDVVVMHKSSALANDKTIDSDPEHGFEITYNRELGRLGEKKDLPWGLEVGLGWTDIEIKDHRPASQRVISDAFNLNGVDPSHNQIPPGHTMPDPYPQENGTTLFPGTFDGPGSLIDSVPNRTISTTTAKGGRQFDADLFTFRLGPYIDIPIDERWSLSFSAGFAVGVVDGEFSFEQTTAAGGRQIGGGSDTDVVYGGYVSASIHVAFSEHWGAFVGGQYLGLSEYSAKGSGQKVEIDLSRTAFFTIGVTYSF